MKIRESELPVVIDVDLTLIGPPLTYTKEFTTGGMFFNYYGKQHYHRPIEKHIDLLKSYKSRGYEVTVHSANGYQWAAEVVKVLGLEEYVDHVATKPVKYVDDKEWDNFCQRVFID